MDWLSALQIAPWLAALVAGAWIGLQQGTIRTLRGANTDLRNRRDDLEKDRAELERDLARVREENAKKISNLEGAVETLTNTVTARDAIDDLTSRLDTHHRESMAVLNGIKAALSPPSGRT